jgi:hypothetical protein
MFDFTIGRLENRSLADGLGLARLAKENKEIRHGAKCDF